ncbi:hypothetical protein [Spirosoma pollinicola]|uniref:Tyr recombinase domain-containing protein n=1 Tax=Spirosoma pollinicola TaxID=2057025 RepID=A0A2K8Z1B9_9BACT|nr:hypothetical protein [Spirosoma pollinicola]AUD03604.1 hypothetical protein CWM47_18280 [Spirosoma pollinicola]
MRLTYTVRHLFVRNAFLEGVITISIMKITGHKSEGQFLKYIKISTVQNALLTLAHPHVSGSMSTVPVLPLHKVA